MLYSMIRHTTNILLQFIQKEYYQIAYKSKYGRKRNQTANEPVMRISNDNSQTFGPILRLAANGTITSK
jgi:hypothetical protein